MAAIYEADHVDLLRVQTLGDTIYIAQSTKTPFARMLRRGPKPNGAIITETVQRYGDHALEGTADGTDKTTYDHTNRESVSAYWMLLRTPGWMATLMANETRTAGVKEGEAAKQKADDDLHLARMHERQLLTSVDLRKEGNGETWRSRGLFGWLDPSAQAVDPVPAIARPRADACYSGALSGVTPDVFESRLSAAADYVGESMDWFGLVGLRLKRRMSMWGAVQPTDSGGTEIMQGFEVKDKRLSQVLDVFQFDAGTVRAMTSYSLLRDESTGAATAFSTRSGAFVDMKMFELRFAIPPRSKQNPDLGGGPRGYAETMYTLIGLNMSGMSRFLIENDT